jgi:hypothetical protein
MKLYSFFEDSLAIQKNAKVPRTYHDLAVSTTPHLIITVIWSGTLGHGFGMFLEVVEESSKERHHSYSGMGLGRMSYT